MFVSTCFRWLNEGADGASALAVDVYGEHVVLHAYDARDVTAFARKVGQSIVADADARVWSLGEMPMLRGGFLESRVAPDFTVPDRAGRPVQLSRFRGKKVLVITWASW